MKQVSDNFIEKVRASVKDYRFSVLISWNKSFEEGRSFFKLDQSVLDGPDLLWSGNQDVIAFMDRYNYANETENCQNFTIKRVVSNNPWGVVQGTATLTMNNTSGRYFPQKDPIIGNYVSSPGRPVKIQVSVDGEFVNLFTGYSNRPEVTIGSRDMNMTCYDAVSYLATRTSSLSVFTNTSMDQIIAALLMEAGFTSDQFALEPAIQPSISFCSPNGKKVIDLMKELCDSEHYLIFADADGIIRGWNANHFRIDSSDQPAWKITYANATDISWSSTTIINDVIVRAKPYKTVPRDSLWLMSAASDDTLVPAGGSIDIFLDLKDDNGNSMYGIDLDLPVQDALNGSSFTTNTATDGSGAKLPDITATSIYSFGDTAKLIFTNNGATDGYVTSVNLFGTSARQGELESLEAQDPDSMEAYGVNPDGTSPGDVYILENNYIQTDAHATQIASAIVNNYSQPMNKFDLSNFVVPYLEIGDFIELDIGSVSDETRAVMVFGIELSGGVDDRFSQKLYVEERQPSSYFVLDQSQLDGPDVLAF